MRKAVSAAITAVVDSGLGLLGGSLSPLRPAAFFWAVVPPWFGLLPDPDFLPPSLEALGELAIRAARALRHPLVLQRFIVIWFTETCLSNALRLETYIADAEREGDSELAEFFRRAQGESRKGAEQGKQLLISRLNP